MKERGMLFSAPMVRAILDGSKTQTRRVVKPQPTGYVETIYRPFPGEPNNWQGFGGGYIHWYGKCPYGQPGDQIWGREAWRTYSSLDDVPPRSIASGAGIQYEAGGSSIDGIDKLEGMGKLRPGMFMPRWASRINLEITGVRVERLQDISETDAKAEGIESAFEATRWRMYPHVEGEEHLQYAGPRWTIDPVRSYRSLWLSINGAGSWDANPWVWVIEFKRVEPGKQEFDIPNFLRKRHDDE